MDTVFRLLEAHKERVVDNDKNSSQSIRAAWESVARNVYGTAFGGITCGFGLGLIPYGADVLGCVFVIGCGAASVGMQISEIKKKLDKKLSPN